MARVPVPERVGQDVGLSNKLGLQPAIVLALNLNHTRLADDPSSERPQHPDSHL
uniref:Uncharacterized protein n=1 Tax=Oryza brachyantha TaxID=4533 RepID=J3MGA3_ORYBR